MVPDSPLAMRARRRGGAQRREPGLNENLAREILELHTLGVDGGYAQDDVLELARLHPQAKIVFTGGAATLISQTMETEADGAKRLMEGLGLEPGDGGEVVRLALEGFSAAGA